MERGMQPAAEQAAPADGAAALPAAPGTAPATATAIPPMPAGAVQVLRSKLTAFSLCKPASRGRARFWSGGTWHLMNQCLVSP